jgi:hypothetical protein
MKIIYYRKEGRRYIPVKEYDDNCMWALPYGDHLVMKYKNGETRVHNIDPALAPMIAAGRHGRDAMAAAIHSASTLRPRTSPLTEEQRGAWSRLEEAYGDDKFLLQWPAAYDVADVAVKAMIAEVDKYMSVPAVKNAYEHFMMVYKLTKENEC